MILLLLACAAQAPATDDTSAEEARSFVGWAWRVNRPDHLPGFDPAACEAEGCRECVTLEEGGAVIFTWWSDADPTRHRIDAGAWAQLDDQVFDVAGLAWTVTPAGAESGWMWGVELEDLGEDFVLTRCPE